MSIDIEFPNNHHVIGKHKNADGEHFHFVWGPGRPDIETSTKSEVQAAYKARGKEYVRLEIHDTMVAVDWDSCLAMPMGHVLRSYQKIVDHHHMDTKNSCTPQIIREKTQLKINFTKYEIGCLLERKEEGDTY